MCSQELDSVVLVDPFQFRIFCGSIPIALLCWFTGTGIETHTKLMCDIPLTAPNEILSHTEVTK